MARKDRLTKKQVFAIPELLKKKSIGEIAKQYGVSWQSIYYWILRLREKGIEVHTRKQGSISKIL